MKGTFTATFTVTQEDTILVVDPNVRAHILRNVIEGRLNEGHGSARATVTVDSATFTPNPPRYLAEPYFVSRCRECYRVRDNERGLIAVNLNREEAEKIVALLNEDDAP